MPGPRDASDPTHTTPLATLGWGFYLAVSWTWIIGMILPALLLRDFGWWSLAVFLLPNAVGAALMGTVLRNAQAAKRLRERHDRAVRRFSMVTIAFHLFVLTAIGLSALGPMGVRGPMGVLVVAAVLAIVLMALGRWLVTAMLVWLASVGLGLAYALTDASAVLMNPQLFRDGVPRGLLLLMPAVVFGFALCPYLDATFLRARASTGPVAGKAAFAFGFFVPFVVMIGFTVVYAGAIASGHSAGWVLVLAHLALQGGFTLAAHLRESDLTLPQRGGTLALTLAALATMWSLPTGPIAWADGMLAWEVVYRVFLSAYGLYFPAYVLYAMVPLALGLGPLPRAGRAVAACTLAVVTPMYGMGFIARQEQWLPLALGLVLAGAFVTFVMRRRNARVGDG